MAYSKRLRHLVGASLVLLTAVRSRADVTVGATREIPDGKLDYTPASPDLAPDSGQYSPRIPLDILPGPDGQAPSIALVYSNKRSNGPFGAGWGLSFESSIERKSRHGGLAEMAPEDTFWIDGQQLIEVIGGTFRTEQDDFTVYSKIEPGGVLLGWKAVKDGFTRYYGEDGTFVSFLEDFSAVEYRDEYASAGVTVGEEPVKWHLSASVTAYGARVHYLYKVPALSHTGESTLRHHIDEIVYAESGSGSSEVQFVYSPRSDVRVSYANGPKRIEARLITSIVSKRVGSTTTTAHEYVFEYHDAIHSPQSMLSAVKRQDTNGGGTEMIASFGYADSESAWGEREGLTLVGAPAIDPGDDEYFSVSLLVDVNADARPDFVEFIDVCDLVTCAEFTGDVEGCEGNATPPPRGEDDSDFQLLGYVPIYNCVPHHRVFINTVDAYLQPVGEPVGPYHAQAAIWTYGRHFLYDAERSQDVIDFYEELHTGFLLQAPAMILDLDKDGRAELLKNGEFAPATEDGWDTSGVPALWGDALDDYQFADINGDGYPDLVGQTLYYQSSGQSPFFDGAWIPIDDPVGGDPADPDDATDDEFISPASDCLGDGDYDIHLEWDYGINEDGEYSSDLWNPPGIIDGFTADGWVWRNTMHADFNGDGLADRLVNYPILHDAGVALCGHDPDDGTWQCQSVWSRDDAACGVFDKLYLGDGRGEFVYAGHGVGGPREREQLFEQTRTLPKENADGTTTYTYEMYLNHFAMGDLDADGRAEVTQFCDGSTQFLALADQGIAEWSGYGPGYGMDADIQDCPSSFTAPVPEEYFGLTQLDYHYSTTGDVDGDGMEDLFQAFHPYGPVDVSVSIDGLPWEDWLEGPQWRENLRATAQNRLTSITWGHGGTTSVSWSWSAAHEDNDFAINVEHVKSLTDDHGASTFEFTEGVFDAGEFLGFGRMETLRPRGSTLVQTFFTLRALRGKPSTEELYDAGGRLKNLRVHLPGSESANVGLMNGLLIDGWAPYYNPLQRVCEYEFAAFNGKAPLGTDIDSYIADCEAFEDEAGIFIGAVHEQRSLFSTLRGGDPDKLAQSASERRELRAFRDLLMGRDPTQICGSDPEGSLPPPRVCRMFVITPFDLATDDVFGPDTGPLVPVTFSAAPHPTSWHVAVPASGLPGWGPTGILLESERVYITEYDEDPAKGRIVEQRELRDISMTKDSLIHEYDYSGWLSSLEGVRLEHELTRDRLGKTYEEIDYENFEHGRWRRKVEHETETGAVRQRNRTFTALGELATMTEPLGRTTTYAYDDCGVVTSRIDPLGYEESTTLDGACRPESIRRKLGLVTLAQTDLAYDGLGRVVSQTVDPAVGSGGAVPEMTEEKAYDAESGTSDPSAVTILAEPDGSVTLTKVYVDGWGRTIRQVRCKQGGSESGGLDETYSCDASTVVTVEQVYDGATGDLLSTKGPYGPGVSGTPEHAFTYDEFGRMVVDEQPDGTSVSYSYLLGKRVVTDPLARKTEIEYDTLDEEVTLNGVLRSSTVRDAFGRVTSSLDAAGKQTRFSYDGFNRKDQETLPAVEVLASGAALPAVVQSPIISYGYDRADRLTSKTDANGHAYTYEYDLGDRLTRTRGPSGTLLEQRTYTDGGYGTRRVTITDSRLGVSREEHQDGIGRAWKRIAFDGAETLIDHDSRGRAWRTTLPWGEVQTTELHDGGLTAVATSTQSGMVGITTTTFDAAGRSLTITDADGQVVTHEYDEMGQLVATWQGDRELEHRVYDDAGRATEIRSAGATTCFELDDFDNVLVEKQGCEADGLVTIERTYTPLGLVETETDGAGGVTSYEYDALGRLTAVEVTDAAGLSLGRHELDYDAVGNKTRLFDEMQLDHRWEYDLRDRVVEYDPPEQGPITFAYDPQPGTWVITTTAPTGEQTEAHRDALGRDWQTCGTDGVCLQDEYVDGLLASRTRLSDTGTVAATRFFQYHPSSSRVWRESDWVDGASIDADCGAGDVTACAAPYVERTWTAAGRADTVTDAQGNVTIYGYDAATASWLLVSASIGGLRDLTYEYDPTYPIQLLRRTSDPAGLAPDLVETTTWERNLRPSGVSRTDGGAVLETVTLGYDAAGRRNHALAARGAESVAIDETFDARGNPITRSYDIQTAGGNYAGAFGFTWRPNGQIETVTYPSLHSITYEYDGSERLSAIRFGAAALYEAQVFDPSGRPTTLRFDGGAITATRTFDFAGREATRSITGIAPALLQETYGYDGSGRLAGIAVRVGVTDVGASTYGYDAANRLTSESHTLTAGGSRSFVYTYDPATGLRTFKNDITGASTTTTSYDYDDGNRLSFVGAAAIGWDAYGRQVGDAAGRTFVWGFADQLLAIDDGGVNLETNLHDAEGLRAARATSAGVEFFLSSSEGELLTRIGAAGTSVDYVRLPNGVEVATIDETGDVTPILRNATGSPYRIGERTADHLWVEASGFGEAMLENGLLDEQLTFHGMFTSAAEGIDIAGVRAYDVTTGRFLTPDPLGFGGAPNSVAATDVFRYAQHNPIAMHDATGYASMPSSSSPRCIESATGGCVSISGKAHYGNPEEQEDQGSDDADDEQTDGGEEGTETEDGETEPSQATDGAEVEDENGTDERSPGGTEAPTQPVTTEPSAGSGGGSAPGDTGAAQAGGAAPQEEHWIIAGDADNPAEEITVTPKQSLSDKFGGHKGLNLVLDVIQFGLDVVGLIEPVGFVADGVNALISLARGDYVGAGLSALAMIPVAGSAFAAAKWGNKSLDAAYFVAAKSGGAGRLWGRAGKGAEVVASGLVDYADEAADVARTSDAGKAADGATSCTGKCGLGDGKKCFAAGTEVQTANGPVRIEDLALGDLVLAEGEDGRAAPRPVVSLFVTPGKEIIDVTFETDAGLGERVSVTPDHPFWVDSRGWTSARALLPGDLVDSSAGRPVRVLDVSTRPGRHTVFNLEIDDLHTYYVGESGALVHNSNDCGGGEGGDGAGGATDGAATDGAAADGASAADPAEPPPEPYNRKEQYGRTPTKADRKALGAGPDEVLDHDPPLVKRWWEGDPAKGEKPGRLMTPAERKASAGDRTRMHRQPKKDSNKQGAEMQRYSRQKNKEHDLE